MATSQLLYPQAYLAMENGDLAQVTDFSLTISTGAKQIHTQRRKGAGISFGNEETSISFNFVIDEQGLERNYVRAAQKKQIKQLRAKLPGGQTLAINGAFSEVKVDGPLDDATKGSATFVGKTEDQ